MNVVDTAVQRGTGLHREHQFKPIVDSLRALAVTVVVAYHTGLPYVSGGFVGVDVFFVISGYLIIGHIYEAVRAGSFSFPGFYARRALRILPPYFLVIAASVIISFFVLALPTEIDSFGQQVFWSALMLANHFFLAQQGYFDTAAELKPLLHLWSLGVEEQFYVFAPLLIVGLWALYRRSGSQAVAIGITIVAFFVSFGLCAWLTPTDDGQNWPFYFMPLRAWEFIAGGVLGFVIPHVEKRSHWIGSALVIVGFAMIMIAVVTFSSDDLFPSYIALLPVLGACLVIVGGVAHPKTFPTRVTTVPPVLWIGLVSYSWYLWHWPLLAFGRIYNFGDRDFSIDISMAALSLVLAGWTYLLLEKPIRMWRRGHGTVMETWKPTLVGFGISAHVVLAGFILFAVSAPRTAMAIPAAMMPGEPSVGAGHCRLETMKDEAPCLKQLGGKPAGLIFGDSHALTAFPVLRRLARKAGDRLVGIMPSSCPAMLDTRTYTRRGTEFKRCGSMIQKGFAHIEKGKIKPEFAVLHARWVTYTPWKGRAAGNGAKFFIGKLDGKKREKDQHAAFVGQLKHTIEKLMAEGVRRILVVGPVPELYRSAPECVIRADFAGIRRDSLCSIPRRDVDARRKQTITWLAEAVKSYANVRLIDPVGLPPEKWSSLK